MRYLLLLALLGLAGCCGIRQEIPELQKNLQTEFTDRLYQFRLERSGQTKLAGLLALKQQGDTMWGGLLDATGIPLLKLQVTEEGNHEIEYCSAAVCDTRLPEMIGKLINSIYFTPPNNECPWYTVSCICEESVNDERIKWKKFGPFRSWELTQKNPGAPGETIFMKMYFSSVQIRLKGDTDTVQY